MTRTGSPKEAGWIKDRAANLPQAKLGLLTSRHFLDSMSGEVVFSRSFADSGGVQVTHHLNMPGRYKIDGLQDHAIAVQGSPRVHHVADIDEHHHLGWAGRGMSWIKPAGTPIAWRWEAPTEVVNIWIASATWSNAVEASVGCDGSRVELVPRFASKDLFIEQVAFALRDEAAAGGPYGRLLRDGLVAALIAYLARLTFGRNEPVPAKGGLSGWRLRIVLEYLNENLAEDVSLAELANLANLSHRHFCTAFRRSVGLPPHRYVVERRIARSKELLADPALSITDVALAVGFGSGPHFATMFKKLVGTTPRAYRGGL